MVKSICDSWYTVGHIHVANSYTGKLYPVDSRCIWSVIYSKECELKGYPECGYWSRRYQTIYDLLMSGF